MPPRPHDPAIAARLRVGIASIWLLTGVFVTHPHFRQLGAAYLDRIGLPAWPMFVACAAEIVLGVWIIRRPMGNLVALGQVAAVLGFTLVLALMDPMLLVHPLGVLSKNLPLLLLITAVWMSQREGWSTRAVHLLRVSVAIVWLTEGSFPKLVFQQAWELDLVARMELFPADPSLVLYAVGAGEIACGAAALLLRGRALRVLLYALAAALVALPVLVSAFEPLLWFHPFGPMTKNIPILFATLEMARSFTGEAD